MPILPTPLQFFSCLEHEGRTGAGSVFQHFSTSFEPSLNSLRMTVETALYDLLGVSPHASEAEIRKAYMKKARLHHPDKNIDDPEANEKFQKMAAAYEILNDPESRAAYDAGDLDGLNGQRQSQGMDPADFLAQFFGTRMPFDTAGPGPGRRGNGSEVVIHPVSLEDLYNGKSVKLDLEKEAICGQCHGSGTRGTAKPKSCATCEGKGFTIAYAQVSTSRIGASRVQCHTCSGTGQVIREKDRCKKCKGRKKITQKDRREIYVEKGMADGQRIVLSGAGDEELGAPPGDVVFVLRAAGHPSFERSGDDLLTRVTITLSEALFGFSRILLTHLDGRGIEVTSPPSKILQPNLSIVLRGQGMPVYKRPDEKGDLFVMISIEMPDDQWLKTVDRKVIEPLLPPKRANPEPRPAIVEQAEFEESDIADFGNDENDWTDEDDDEDDLNNGQPDCQTQ